LDWINVRPLSKPEKLADVAMAPLMRVISGAPSEVPQSTHRWNNAKLDAEICSSFRDDCMVEIAGDPAAKRMWYGSLPLFHLPILGGWKRYVVLQSERPHIKWYVGWITQEVCGYSRIPSLGATRSLIGPGNVKFFGLNAAGLQIPIRMVGEGKIGDGGEWRNLPLR